VGLGRHHSLAHQASARLNRLAAKVPPCWSPTDQRRAEALAGCRISWPSAAAKCSVMKCLKPPLARTLTWDRTPLGLETATPDQPRAALAVEGSEETLELQLPFGESGAAPGG
jgi:hypothetical protein